ncbi:MAG: Na(+)-translocating NADH-quinone reductase subunit F [Bacteroidetes bacterium]|nr:Na(+)-translocating NADH-quinone reductase subunit F [Bacteroidota bacterium]
MEDNILPIPLSDLEKHQLAMNIVGKELEVENYEFLSVNSQLKKDPQFVCTKEKKLSFIIVKAICYPNDPRDIVVSNLDKIKTHATSFNATLYYAGVGLANSENYELPLFKNSGYIINFNGLEKIN